MPETLTIPPIKIRQELLEIVLKDLRGPAGGEDEFTTEQTVRDRYILGLLAPQGQTPLPLEEDEDLALDGTDNEDGKSEPVNVEGCTILPTPMSPMFTYNCFHNSKESAVDIFRLRELHVEMDRAVASAYGWDDLELGYGFHETAQ